MASYIQSVGKLAGGGAMKNTGGALRIAAKKKAKTAGDSLHQVISAKPKTGGAGYRPPAKKPSSTGKL